MPGWDGETDLIVVGSGAGGISAAIEARRAGADVLVLELFHIPGGSSSLSGGVCYLGGGTPLQGEQQQVFIVRCRRRSVSRIRRRTCTAT